MVTELFEPDAGQRVPVYLWGRRPDPAAVRQLQRIASQPYAALRVAGMPDLHVSEGVAVGTVFATERAVVPGALGGDLGCGMSALRFDLGPGAPWPGRRELDRVVVDLGRVIPVGDTLQAGAGLPLPERLAAAELSTRSLCRKRDTAARWHLGTLGGGNHFVELDRDAGGGLWVLVHTGSRGMGAAVRKHHEAAACAGGQPDGAAALAALAALDTEAPAGRAYVDDVGWALAFARENRRVILGRAAEVISSLTGAEPAWDSLVDVHHNFVSREQHGGRDLWVHRKGAVGVEAGQAALVPGSMGTASYLVEGLGERLSLRSCSHGAGRVMSRTEARKRIDPRALERSMRRVAFDRSKLSSLVEESPKAYRDIAEVLEDEADLVAPTLRLEPIAVLKG
jgi:tRNA-splicing ligase RtcB (3'-phosphate/5'-hydroxy nucleic acid ligase)